MKSSFASRPSVTGSPRMARGQYKSMMSQGDFQSKEKIRNRVSNKNYLANSLLVLCCMLKIVLPFAYIEQEKFSTLCTVRRACSKRVTPIPPLLHRRDSHMKGAGMLVGDLSGRGPSFFVVVVVFFPNSPFYIYQIYTFLYFFLCNP